jgi:hypothetical protein
MTVVVVFVAVLFTPSKQKIWPIEKVRPKIASGKAASGVSHRKWSAFIFLIEVFIT